VEHVRRAGDGLLGDLAVLDRPRHHLQAGARLELPVVAESPDGETRKTLIGRLQQPRDESLSDLPCGARDQDSSRIAHRVSI
jgi:hypothetical protein